MRNGNGAALALVCVLTAACSARDGNCRRPAEPPRALQIDRPSDRQHLADDLRQAQTIADAYGDWAAAHPPDDSRFVTPGKLHDHAREYCRALLSEEIAAVHQVDASALDSLSATPPH